MSEARRAIFAAIRERLARVDEAAADAAVRERLARPRAVLVPARARLEGEARIALFCAKAQAVGTEIVRIPDLAALRDAVSTSLRRHNLPSALVRAADPLLDAAALETEPLLEVRCDVPRETDAVGLTVALAGIAETGTVLLASAPERPTLLAFLPETSLVVLPTVRIAGSYEEAWATLRGLAGWPPRSVNLITGPSRTGDIPPAIELGAHGPKRLIVFLLDRPS
ncbi:MAG: LUD domain-containing protein [Geminicoccaceae bacterium]|nr:LUD domain-containing protein [Geminicoccaceae bacterium]MCS7267474.1 LUD domain-containing protein [Geminicoccaceae bacterium]MCX7629155.1 LUD domain-containing protein [Geminicoccaceae bacterium]MDW8123678.1 LUD domain-containing protein [Geminicoccaceae bacterium]MDW8342416.1 LUD domain-containing protein [Geminicoccaceae bacterium]